MKKLQKSVSKQTNITILLMLFMKWNVRWNAYAQTKHSIQFLLHSLLNSYMNRRYPHKYIQVYVNSQLIRTDFDGFLIRPKEGRARP